MKKLIARIFGSIQSLNPLERLVLGGIRERLPASTQILWDKQIAAINKVQRLPDGAEVDFYRMKNGRPSFDGALAFQNRSEELLIATVQLKSQHNGELTASVWSINGFLFSIEYGGQAAYFAEAADMDPPLPLTIDCDLVADLTATQF